MGNIQGRGWVGRKNKCKVWHTWCPVDFGAPGVKSYIPKKILHHFRVPLTVLERVHGDYESSTPDAWRTRRDELELHGVRSDVKVLSLLRWMCIGSSLSKMDDRAEIGTENLCHIF